MMLTPLNVFATKQIFDESKTAADNATASSYAVILAGGSGTRLWPLSRQQLPKQFLSLCGSSSLLVDTIHRVSNLIDTQNILLVTQEMHAKGEPQQELLPYQKLFEPVAKNTAPAIALAAAWLSLKNKDAIMIVLPADHMIENKDQFQDCLRQGIEIAKKDQLVTFGICPTRPDTGFGYIQTSSKFCSPELDREIYAFHVKQFTEKPDYSTAVRFLESGDYFWNSGMFVWKCSTILSEIQKNLPDVFEIIQSILNDYKVTQNFQQAVQDHFHKMPSISIDYGVLEKSDKVTLIPCNIGWNDVGSWQAVHDISKKDEQGNTIQGNVIALDCKNTFIRSEKRLVAVLGVQDLCIVETTDAVMISKSDQSQKVGEVVKLLNQRSAIEHISHKTVKQPWGHSTIIDDDSQDYQVKHLYIEKNQTLILQNSENRSYHWTVLSGKGTLWKENESFLLEKKQTFIVDSQLTYRVENQDSATLHLLEVRFS